MDKFKLYQVLASLTIAIFIVNFAMCLLAFDKKTFAKKAQDTEGLTSFESVLVYNQINDSFKSFFKSKYKIAGYELSDMNTKALNQIKWIYRGAWLVSLVTLFATAYMMNTLSKRRMYMPYIYGAALSAFLTALYSFLMFIAKKGVGFGIKSMILYGDYGFFRGSDVLTHLFPEDFARALALRYILIVGILIVACLLIRLLIAFNSRPHKF